MMVNFSAAAALGAAMIARNARVAASKVRWFDIAVSLKSYARKAWKERKEGVCIPGDRRESSGVLQRRDCARYYDSVFALNNPAQRRPARFMAETEGFEPSMQVLARMLP